MSRNTGKLRKRMVAILHNKRVTIPVIACVALILIGKGTYIYHRETELKIWERNIPDFGGMFEMRNAIEDCIDRYPDNVMPRLEYARTLINQGDYEGSVREYTRAIENNSRKRSRRMCGLYWQRSYAYSLVGDTLSMQNDLKKAFRLCLFNPRAKDLLVANIVEQNIAILRAQGRYAEARRILALMLMFRTKALFGFTTI